jgi:beta-glucosidase
MIGGDLEEPPVAGTDSLLTALTARAKMTGATVTYAKGTDVLGVSDEGFAAAVNAAKEADVAVLALGETGDMSGEAGSRAHLGLPGNQKALLDAVAATGRPVILLVFSGRPLVLTDAVQHTTAILEAWCPGTEGGSAIAAVLFGDAVPGGKLPMSFPRAVGQEPLYYNHFSTGRPADSIDLAKPPTGDTRFFSRYIDVPNDPLFPFGFGLSYTTFAYSGVTVSRHSIPLREANHPGAKQLLVATASVTNTGSRTATDVVQCYVRNRGASVEQPVRNLKGFERVTLRPGESKNITFPLGFAELSFYNSDNHALVEPTEYTIWIGGSSQATDHAQFRIVP